MTAEVTHVANINYLVPNPPLSPIQQVPKDILIYIFSFLTPPYELGIAARTCKFWQRCAQDNTLWNPILQRELCLSVSEDAIQVFKRLHLDMNKKLAEGIYSYQYIQTQYPIEGIALHPETKQIIVATKRTFTVYSADLNRSSSRAYQNSTPLTSLVPLPNQRVIAFFPSKLKILDLPTGKIVKNFKRKSDYTPVFSLPNQRGHLVTGYNDKKVIIWDPNKRWCKRIREFYVKESISCAVLNREQTKLIVGHFSGNISTWDLNKKNEESVFSLRDRRVNSLTICKETDHLIVIYNKYGERSEIFIYDQSQRTTLKEIDEAAYNLKVITLFKNLLFTRSNKGNLYLHDLTTGEKLRSYATLAEGPCLFNEGIFAIQTEPDRILVSDFTASIRMVLKNIAEIFKKKNQQLHISAMERLNRIPTEILSELYKFADGEEKFKNLPQNQKAEILEQFLQSTNHLKKKMVKTVTSETHSLIPTPLIQQLPKELLFQIFSWLEPKSLAACQATCRQWSLLANDNLLWKQLLERHFPGAQLTSQAETYQQAYKRHCDLTTINLTQGIYANTFIRLPSLIQAFTFHQERLILAADNRVMVYSKTGELLKTSSHPFATSDPIHRFFPLPSNQLLACFKSGKIKLLDLNGKGAILKTFKKPVESPVVFAFTTANHLIAGYQDNTVIIFHFATRQILHSFSIDGGLACGALHPDNNQIYFGAENGQISVWDLSSGQGLQIFSHQSTSVTSLIFSQTEKLIASYNDEESHVSKIVIYDLGTGQISPPFLIAGAEVQFIAVTKQDWLICKCSKGTIQIWDLTYSPLNFLQSFHTRKKTDPFVFNDGCFVVAANLQEIIISDFSASHVRVLQNLAEMLKKPDRKEDLLITLKRFLRMPEELKNAIYQLAGSKEQFESLPAVKKAEIIDRFLCSFR
jgi:WD40 repeat protein